jgi:YegS/Rv2252/BmrU family lipid kinase
MASERVKRSLFILNPAAGIQPVRYILSKELQRRRNYLSLFRSLSVDESGLHIKKSFENFDVFVAAGGDGTVRSVASELIGTNKALAVLPMGSGNGFAREFGFRPNIPSLLKDIDKDQKMIVDVIYVNNNLCLNVAGVGLDSFVAHSFNKLGTRGFWSYAYATLKNFISLKPFRVTVSLENETISENLFSFTFANTRQFGNNAIIAPEAKPNDGIIDLVMVKPFPKYLVPLIAWRLFRGTMNKSAYVRYIKTDKPFTISTGEKRFHIDGEAIELSGDINVGISRDSLLVLKSRNNKL